MKRIKKAILFLAVLTMLAAGCVQPALEEPAAPGAGILRVNLDGGASRTLMPSLSYDLDSLYYTLVFTFSAGDREPVIEHIDKGDTSGKFILAAGTWNLTVQGFSSDVFAGNPANALVKGATSVEVSSSEGKEVNVTLVPASGLTQKVKGTLRYNIRFPSGVTSASLTIYDEDGVMLTDLKDPDDVLVANPISLSLPGANTGSIVLNSGVYNLGITLYMNGKAAITGTTAHIYDGLTTAAEYVFTKDDFAYSPNAITAFTLMHENISYKGKIYGETIIVPAPGLSDVTVLIPPFTLGYGLGSFKGIDPYDNWASGFRGRGWDGSKCVDGTAYTNTYITLTIDYLPE